MAQFKLKSMQMLSLTWSQWHNNIDWFSWQSIVLTTSEMPRQISRLFLLEWNFHFQRFFQEFLHFHRQPRFFKLSVTKTVSLELCVRKIDSRSITQYAAETRQVNREVNERKKNWTKLSASRKKTENWEVNERKVKTLLVLLNQFVILKEKQNSAREEKHTKKRLQNRVSRSIDGDWWIQNAARN